MSYNYTRREVTIEYLAELVITHAAGLSDCWRPASLNVEGRRHQMMLERFARGDVLDDRDDAALEAVGKALIADVEGMLPGYSALILRGDTREDVYVNAEIQRRHDMLIRWQEFRDARNRLRGKVRAMRLLADL
ncbi:hypothetical protein CLG85_017530 [Yangia mangrovi]|uniref:Uncharacterized protein n=1 Tax=Alloyangia mangrovi TaxID=1779329 RepID=A0A2A3K2S1_9RHOB|nr:hypothetical protein [Alloyangia mangrovi]MCT4372023.1 hypothetical protein [Alloyangia mangrovi]